MMIIMIIIVILARSLRVLQEAAKFSKVFQSVVISFYKATLLQNVKVSDLDVWILSCETFDRIFEESEWVGFVEGHTTHGNGFAPSLAEWAARVP